MSRTAEVLLLRRPGAHQRCSFHGPRPVSRPRPDRPAPEHRPGAARRRAARLADRLCAGRSRQEGIVLGQSPAGGQTILQGTAVTLRVGSGPLLVVPDVVGQFRAAARRRCARRLRGDGRLRRRDRGRGSARHGRAAGAGRRNVEPGRRDDRRARPRRHRDRARRQRPGAGAAQAALAAVGLGSDAPAGVAGGTVAGQTPTAGASLEIGSLVHIQFGASPRRRAHRRPSDTAHAGAQATPR